MNEIVTTYLSRVNIYISIVKLRKECNLLEMSVG